ncbi:MAG: hypothetical protein HY820_05665 [Acidobacteria bacterium]|nr:hypothetical protein [Acidobacteriota bacterium]
MRNLKVGTMMKLWFPLLGLLLHGLPSMAQQPTRAAEIEKERDRKAATLEPDEVSPLERRMRMIKDEHYLERFTAGFNGVRAKLGGMVTGGGFAFGPEYFREDLLRGQLTARAMATFSLRGYQKYEGQLLLPRLAGGKLVVDSLVSHRAYRSLPYYGPGADSTKHPRTNYSLTDTSIDGIVAAEPWKYVKFGTSLGYLTSDIGTGTDKRYVSTERVFSPAQSPGLLEQSSFVRPGIFAQFDYRDNPLGARKGGNYVMQYSWFNDVTLERYGFRRLDLEVQQFIPILNKTRVFAFRAKASLTDTDRNEQVPFYLQPVLGGSDDLRGFRPFRFSDRNSFVMNGEYRWEIFSGLDGALFVDGGKVFPRRGMLNFRDLEASYGLGLRFNARNSTFLRIDAGFSHEGFQVWFKFNDVFLQRRFGTTTGQPVY